MISNNNIINFAEGGSEIKPKGPQGFVTKSVGEQITHFKKIVKYMPSWINNNFEHTLFIIYAGGNDFIEQTYEHKPIKLAEIIYSETEQIIQSGAKYILLPNFFDITLTSRIKSLSNTDPKMAEQLSNDIYTYNKELDNKIIKLMNKYAVILLKPDFHNFLSNTINENIFRNSANYCNKSGYIDTITQANLCRNHLDYLFWDDIHPSTKAHCLLSNFTIQYINVTLNYNINEIKNCELDYIK